MCGFKVMILSGILYVLPDENIITVLNQLCFQEYEDGDLSAWINRERFQNYLTVDGFLLYELGDTGTILYHRIFF